MPQKTIHKFTLHLEDDEVQIDVPEGSTFLTVQAQRDEICMWFLVDPTAPKIECTYLIRGTGHNADAVGDYLGTVQLHKGSLVLHVFTKKAN